MSFFSPLFLLLDSFWVLLVSEGAGAELLDVLALEASAVVPSVLAGSVEVVDVVAVVAEVSVEF